MKENKLLNYRYRVLRPIGYGGMAEVYLAHDEVLDRNVAIKMLRDQYIADKDLLAQFQREAKSAARLIHPYIINIYDVVSDGDNQYIVMEYVDGVTLKEYLIDQKPPLNAVLEIGVRLADALQHAHAHNVIHCDIKPHNILLDKNMNPKIADFGIAKIVTNQTMVYTKEVMGSVYYISPEQASGGKITASSDVYSLGIVIFEMLTGKVPYNGGTAIGVAMMHVEKPVPQLADYMQDVPEGMQAIIDKALAKRSEDRYADAGELRRDLMALKMKLFPHSSDDYRKQLGETIAKQQEAVLDAEGATIVVPPMRGNGLEDGATVIMQPVRSSEGYQVKNSEPSKPQVVRTGDAGDGEVKKKKLNYTKLLLLITAVVVMISMIAHFVLSGNLKEVAVPDVKNMTVVEAQKLLEENKFKVDLREEYGDPAKFKAGSVMEQSPKAGEKRKQGSLVVLTISRGAELKGMPDVVSMSLSKAEQTLENAGFKVGKVTKKHDKKQRIGTVLSQSPKALDKTPKGTYVDLVVNEGDKAVPNLVGKSLDEAKQLLAQAGLTLGEVKKIQDHSAAKNSILATNPSAGVMLGEGDAVSVSIADVPAEKKNTYVDFVIPGTKLTNVQIVLVDEQGKKTLYQGQQKGGVRLRQGVTYVGKAHLDLYCDNKVVQSKQL